MKNFHALAAAGLVASLVSASAHAQSSVTLYGVVGTQLVSASGKTSLKKLDSNGPVAPRFGVKGSEDLGGGLTAFFGLESGLSPDTGTTSTPFWGRGSYLGVSSGFGSLSVGRQWNLNDDFCGLYVCGGYSAFYNLPGFGNTSDLVNNAIKYKSPSFGGFSGGLMFAPGEGVSGKYQSASLAYGAGPLSAGLSIDSQANLAGAKDTLTTVAAKYAFGPAFVRAAYVDSKPDASKLGDASAFDLGVGYSFTPLATVSLDYIAMDRKNSANDVKFVRLFGVYQLSKRTQLNGNIISVKNSGASALALAGATVSPGGSQTVVTFGIAHSF